MTTAWISVARSSSFAVMLVVLPLLTDSSDAATLSEARSAAIGWLESHQNADGSWGSGERQPLVTAEALLALAKSEHCALSSVCRDFEAYEE